MIPSVRPSLPVPPTRAELFDQRRNAERRQVRLMGGCVAVALISGLVSLLPHQEGWVILMILALMGCFVAAARSVTDKPDGNVALSLSELGHLFHLFYSLPNAQRYQQLVLMQPRSFVREDLRRMIDHQGELARWAQEEERFWERFNAGLVQLAPEDERWWRPDRENVES